MVDPVIKRVQATVRHLMSFATKNKGDKISRMSFVLYGIVDELMEELNELQPEKLEQYFVLMGSMMTWIGTGDQRALPPELRPFAAEIAGEPVWIDPESEPEEADGAEARPVLALPSGSVSE